MPERGDPTIQSGTLYQNSTTALYLGRLCDPSPRLDIERVFDICVETPHNVDDTVVTFADDHRDKGAIEPTFPMEKVCRAAYTGRHTSVTLTRTRRVQITIEEA